jgi:putative flippase GtrA
VAPEVFELGRRMAGLSFAEPGHRPTICNGVHLEETAPIGEKAEGSRESMQESRKKTAVKYAQFSLVGGSNALVDIGVLNLLLLISPTRSPEILVAYNVVALVLTNANSYLWNTLWTFRHRARHDARQVGLFTVQGMLNVAVGGLVLWLLAHWLVAYTDLSPLVGGNVAKVASMVAASTMSFLFLRYFVFRRAKR